jgi:hypothetical protein
MLDMLKLMFQGDNRLPTLTLMTAAFLLGVIVEMIAAKVFGSKPKARVVAKGDRKAPRGDVLKPERRHPAPDDGSIEIYVGNLSYELTEDQLRAEFAAFGTVNSVRVITNRYNNKSKGFGFVHMPVRAEADAAIKALNGKEIQGRRITCNEARNAS